MAFFKESQFLSISFRDIEESTKNFTTLIGRGGYGNVYKGELSISSGELTTVAVKRLDINLSGQGLKEFLTEIHLLSRYKHPNLVSLLGYCDESNEKILVYEYAEHGSLDKYLNKDKTKPPLTWKQRINICTDAARGLDYLHNHVAENHRVIHRDIKSANILLDRNSKGMIADLGLSKIGRANEDETYLITDASGTYGYCDPVYIDSGILTKESDVYSFGVVLFEILCGRLCFVNVNNEQRFLAPLAQRYYEETRLDEIIDPDLKRHIGSESLKKFAEIAYECLQNERELRPSMGLVVQKLVQVLELLKLEERRKQEFEERRRIEVLEERRRIHDLENIRRIEVREERRRIHDLDDIWRIHKHEERRMQVWWIKKHELEERRRIQELEGRRRIQVLNGRRRIHDLDDIWRIHKHRWRIQVWRIKKHELEERRRIQELEEVRRIQEYTERMLQGRLKELDERMRIQILHAVGMDVRKAILVEERMQNTDKVVKVYKNSPMTYGTMKKISSQISSGFSINGDNEKSFWSIWLKPETWNNYITKERKMKQENQKTCMGMRREQKTLKKGRKWKHF